jgi:hypothetical protein
MVTMLHRPNLLILDRAGARREVAELASVGVPALIELVNIATLIFSDVISAPAAEREVGFPLLTLYLHAIEICDAISVLIPQGMGWPAVALMRSLFECLLSIEYLVEDDSDRRAAAWWATSLNNSIQTIQRLDARTLSGKQFLNAVKADKGFTGWGSFPEDVMDRFYRSMEGVLANPRYAEAAEEYSERKASEEVHRPGTAYSTVRRQYSNSRNDSREALSMTSSIASGPTWCTR